MLPGHSAAVAKGPWRLELQRDSDGRDGPGIGCPERAPSRTRHS